WPWNDGVRKAHWNLNPVGQANPMENKARLATYPDLSQMLRAAVEMGVGHSATCRRRATRWRRMQAVLMERTTTPLTIVRFMARYLRSCCGWGFSPFSQDGSDMSSSYRRPLELTRKGLGRSCANCENLIARLYGRPSHLLDLFGRYVVRL